MDSNDKLRLTNMLQEYHSMRRERNFIASVKCTDRMDNCPCNIAEMWRRLINGSKPLRRQYTLEETGLPEFVSIQVIGEEGLVLSATRVTGKELLEAHNAGRCDAWCSICYTEACGELPK